MNRKHIENTFRVYASIPADGEWLPKYDSYVDRGVECVSGKLKNPSYVNDYRFDYLTASYANLYYNLDEGAGSAAMERATNIVNIQTQLAADILK